jgi:hypothetical protein
MKVKPVNPANAAGLIDPVTKRSPFVDPMTGAVLDTADVPETLFWHRRLLHGEIELVGATPTGAEPVAPLTTRGKE